MEYTRPLENTDWQSQMTSGNLLKWACNMKIVSQFSQREAQKAVFLRKHGKPGKLREFEKLSKSQ